MGEKCPGCGHERGGIIWGPKVFVYGKGPDKRAFVDGVEWPIDLFARWMNGRATQEEVDNHLGIWPPLSWIWAN